MEFRANLAAAFGQIEWAFDGIIEYRLWILIEIKYELLWESFF